MSSYKFIAILGRQPELGLVELESVLGRGQVARLTADVAQLTAAPVLDTLGGSIRVAEIVYRGPKADLRNLPIDVARFANQHGRTVFGLSVFGQRLRPAELLAAGLEMKRSLKAIGSVRLVRPSQGTALRAAELIHNAVLEDGFELVVVFAKGEMVIARTTAIQDIEAYTRRDHERPARSADVGMLPPKLAQILINTTRPGAVFDPFCGTGVVLQEARLMGRPAAGSDLSSEMVAATMENMAWLETTTATTLPAWSAEEADATRVKLPEGVAIVSEGYLGPNLHTAPPAAELDQIRANLRSLYVAALENFARQLPSGGEVSICAPVWRVGHGWRYLDLVDEIARLGYTRKGFEAVSSDQLVYARNDQTVGRQLLLLRKN